jgi:hypothetical protein
MNGFTSCVSNFKAMPQLALIATGVGIVKKSKPPLESVLLAAIAAFVDSKVIT